MIKSDTSLGGTAIPSRDGKIEFSVANSAQSVEGVSNMSSFSKGLNAVHCGANYQIGAAAFSLRRGGGSAEASAFAVLEDETSGWEVVSSRRPRARLLLDVVEECDECGEECGGECYMEFGGEVDTAPWLPQDLLSPLDVARMRFEDSRDALLREENQLIRSLEEEKALLRELPCHLVRLIELDALITPEQDKLQVLKEALQRGHTYGEVIDPLLEEAVRPEVEAFEAAVHVQEAAIAKLRAHRDLQPRHINPPHLPKEPKEPQKPEEAGKKARAAWEKAHEAWKQAHEGWGQQVTEIKAGFKAAIRAERERTEAINELRVSPLRAAIATAKAACDAAKKVRDEAKARELPLLAPKLEAKIAALSNSGAEVAHMLISLGKRIAPIIASAHDVIALGRVVKVDSILLAAEEKREKFACVTSICIKTRERVEYDEDGDLPGAQKQVLPEVLDFAPLSLKVETYADVLSLAQYKELLARLFPESPDVARMLCQLEEIRTRSSAPATQSPVPARDAVVRPQHREVWGLNGLVSMGAVKLVIKGGEVTMEEDYKSLMRDNMCHNKETCTNFSCLYKHAPCREAVLSKALAAYSERTSLPVRAAAPPTEDKVSTYLSLLTSGASTREFTIAKVIKWAEEKRMHVLTLEGMVLECIRSGQSAKLGDIILVEGSFMRGTFKRTKLDKLKAALGELHSAFFKQSEFQKPVQKKVTVSRVSTLEESGLPMPPEESEEEESEEE